MPSYQKLAVNDYVNAHLTPSPYPAGTYNTSGVSVILWHVNCAVSKCDYSRVLSLILRQMGRSSLNVTHRPGLIMWVFFSANYVIGKSMFFFLSNVMQILNSETGVDGTLSLVFGTSASAPVVASIITLINDARIAIGKGPVGFINPVVRPVPLFMVNIAFNDGTSFSIALLAYICACIQRHCHRR